MSVESYIESLALSGPDTGHLSPSQFLALGSATRSGEAMPPASPDTLSPKLQAAVDAGSILSFVSGISSAEKDDVLYSVQLAQRGASGAHDRFNETASWYRKYLEILERLGWVAEELAFARNDQSAGEFRMDKAALAAISAFATQNQLSALQETMKALSALADDDGAIRLFDYHTAAQASGNFQIGAVQKSDNEALSLALGAFHFRCNDARRRFLFFAWGAKDIEFWSSAQKMTLNPAHYAGHREAVKQKLGVSAINFIAELAIV